MNLSKTSDRFHITFLNSSIQGILTNDAEMVSIKFLPRSLFWYHVFYFQNLNTNKLNSPQHPILGFVKNDADNQKGFAHPYYTHARIPGRSEQKIKLSFTQRIATGAMLFEA